MKKLILIFLVPLVFGCKDKPDQTMEFNFHNETGKAISELKVFTLFNGYQKLHSILVKMEIDEKQKVSYTPKNAKGGSTFQIQNSENLVTIGYYEASVEMNPDAYDVVIKPDTIILSVLKD